MRAMDGGWAAVIAGAAGAGGAGLSAWATAHAMIKQVRMQASDQHEQWLREQRQEMYVNLLSATDDVYDKLNPIIVAVVVPDADPDVNLRAAWQDMNAAVRESARAAQRVSLVGPPTLAQAATRLHEAVLDTVNVFRSPGVLPADQRAIFHAETRERWQVAEEHFRRSAYMIIGKGDQS
ncbi:hypothetical protein [Streptomyces sp. NPDC055006]